MEFVVVALGCNFLRSISGGRPRGQELVGRTADRVLPRKPCPILASPAAAVKGLFWAVMSAIRAAEPVVGQQCSYIMLPLQPPSYFGLVVKEHTTKGSFEGGFLSPNEFRLNQSSESRKY